MAATVTISRGQNQAVTFGDLRGRIVDVAFGSSDYPTAGYSITPNSVGLAEIVGVTVLGINNSVVTAESVFIYNVSTSKLQAFGTNGAADAALAERSNGADLSATVVRLLIVGV